jgi:hypothetical protein
MNGITIGTVYHLNMRKGENFHFQEGCQVALEVLSVVVKGFKNVKAEWPKGTDHTSYQFFAFYLKIYPSVPALQ